MRKCRRCDGKYFFESQKKTFRAPSNYDIRDGWTAMHSAASSKNLEVIKMLIDNGGDVNVKTKKGETPLDVAIKNNWENRYREMIDFLKTVQKPTLSTAVKTNNLDALKELLKDKENLKKINDFGKNDYNNESNGKTLLYYAAELGYGDICRELIKAGANPALKGERDCDLAPIVCAGRGGYPDAVKAFIEVKDKIPQHQLASALSEAATSSRNPSAKPVDTVKMLLDAGVGPEWSTYEDKDKKGYTPFQTALLYGTKEVVDIFLAKGLKMPFWAACKWGDTARMKELISKGEDINKEGFLKELPICYAVKSNQIDAVKLLLENKCKINFDLSSGSSFKPPIYMAAEKGYTQIAEFLLKAGANPNYGEQDDMMNNSPLFIALQNEHYDTAEALLKSGAKTDVYDISGERDETGKYKEFNLTMFAYFKEKKDEEALKLLKKYKK